MAGRLFLRGFMGMAWLGICCHLATCAESWKVVAPRLSAHPMRQPSSAQDEERSRFVMLPPAQTGIDFVNRLDWDHPLGLLFDTGYACGGIAVGDVDGNGLPDLFFVSGPNRNRLYLQFSPWQFVESTAAAGLPGDDQLPLGGDGWGTGAALFDIDNDGDLDLYVCNYDAANLLFINRGAGKFDERAADYGLDIVDASLMPAVADYDRDGDLDIYLAMNRYLVEKQFHRRDLFYWKDGSEKLRPSAKKYFAIRRHFDHAEQLNMWAGRRDRLLRNEGPGKQFTDVSSSLSLQRGDTLSATWWDYDHDGWPDLYVANDLAAPDRLFHNLGAGKFEDVTRHSLPHTPWLAMGSSAGDINNDGLVDFLVADMAFRTHFKDKLFMGDMSAKFRNASFFPDVQLMRNALYVNTGTEHFQEAAYLAGLASTDWTWTAKLADLDNDGWLDAYFTNGSPVNLADSPQTETPSDHAATIDTSLVHERHREMPPVLEQNLAYQNQGDLKFVDRSKVWGLDHVGMSFGAVHADLDRDGDLDLVVANLDEPPSVYRNDSRQRGVLVELRGEKSNRLGIGAEVTVETDHGKQLRQIYPVAGFQSCQETIAHFGVGDATSIGRLTVRWPSGAEQVFENLPSGQRYRIEESEFGSEYTVPSTRYSVPSPQTLFIPLNALQAEHHEEPFDDFARQPLLPNKLSQLGPPMAWGDVDGDGDDDLFLGEGTDWMGMLYINEGDARFTSRPQIAFARDADCEDRAAVFFDANGDGNLDLYVGSGSVECEPGDERLRDRLYLGDGTGSFDSAADGWLLDLRISTGAVAAADFDRDGDVDLVVGGRSVPGQYPLAPPHALLRNDGDHFADVLAEAAPELATAGMITAAVWADVNGDGWDDLLVATDWGPVRLFQNHKGKFVETTTPAGLNQWTGWWQSLACSDVDNDGDLDFIAGNFGLNTKYKATPERPVLAYYGEYGDEGERHLIEASYEGEVLFPLRGKSCSSAAMPHLTKRFKTYETFAKATLDEIYTPDCLQQAERFEVNTLSSACFLNDGTGHYTLVALPTAAQLAPVFAIAVTEVNGDNIPDLFLAQNFFTPQRETGPMDGGLGVVAIGNGDGTFEALRPDRAGVVVPGDAKAATALDLDGDGWLDLCVATNNGPLSMFLHRGKKESPRPAEQQQQEHSAWVEPNLALARQFAETDQWEEGLPYLRRALKVAPQNAEALLLLSIVRREQGRFAEAGKLLDHAERAGIDSTQLLIERGLLYFQLKQYDRAAKLLQQATRIPRADSRVHAYLGEVRLLQGRLRDARQEFTLAQRADLLAVAEQRAVEAESLFEEGLQAQQDGDEAEAIRLWEKSRRINAQPHTIRALANLLRSTKDETLRDPWLAGQLEHGSEAKTP